MSRGSPARKDELVLGTRGSALALAQCEIVCRALRQLDPAIAIRVQRITTTGDTRADVPLSQLGRGIFVTELEAALRAGQIDFAVHSAKDLPSTLAGDLTLGAVLPRADARDVLVSRHGSLQQLPAGARVGTSSPRRACQLRGLRPDVEPCDVRGNVDTRLRKLAAGEFDALLLAAAGLTRLGLEGEATEWFDAESFIPSVGQGALVVEVRADDEATLAFVRQLDHAATRLAVTAERAFLAELGAGCRAAAGAHATLDHDGRMHIGAFIGAVDGRQVRATRTGDAADAEAIGSAIARELLRHGGAAFLGHANGALAGKMIAITRPEAQSAELTALLRANGADTVWCPTIAIERVMNHDELDAALRDLSSIDWIVFTSANAVHEVADRLEALDAAIPASVRLAAVGAGTAAVLAARLRAPAFVPSLANAETLANELPDVQRRTLLFPHGDLAAEVTASRLRERGGRVHEVVVYRTVEGAGTGELASRVSAGTLDAVLFMSPSSIRFAAEPLLAALLTTNHRPAIVCIGPSTARAACDAGLTPDGEAVSQSIGGIVETLERCLDARERTTTSSSH